MTKEQLGLEEAIVKGICEASNCDIAIKANCQVNFGVVCEGCYKIKDGLISLLADRCWLKDEEREALHETCYDVGIEEPWAGEYQTAFRNGQRHLIHLGWKPTLEIVKH